MTNLTRSSTNIKVCDAIMGSGKTTAAINYMRDHARRKFLYITPRLTEDSRIAEHCPMMNFAMPDDHRQTTTKLKDLKELLGDGRNVAITHVLFSLCDDEVCDLVRQHGYSMIIDEVVDVLRDSRMTAKDVEGLIAADDAAIDEHGYVQVSEQYLAEEHGTIFQQAMRLAKSHKLYRLGKSKFFSWVVSDRMLQAADEVIIMTYKFESSSMARLLKEMDAPYTYLYVDTDGAGNYWFTDHMAYIPPYFEHLSKLVRIVDNKRLNKFGSRPRVLSKSWWEKQGKAYKGLALYDEKRKEYRDTEESKKLAVSGVRKDIYSYFMYELKGIPSSDMMVGGFAKSEELLVRKGFLGCFLVLNATSMNDFSHKHYLAYPVNIFSPRELLVYYRAVGMPGTDDDFALTMMVQWIWRSAIRNGEPIEIYLPSSRMRRILKKWIAEVEAWYHAFYTATGETSAPDEPLPAGSAAETVCEENDNEGGETETQENPAA